MSSKWSLQRVLVTLMFLASSVVANAQSDRGTLAGTVTDTSGAVVQGASVTARGTATGAVYKAQSSGSGAYRIPDMALGTYDVAVSAPGFKSTNSTGVVIQINTTASVDVQLQAGNVSETVDVTADAPTLQTESSDIGTVVDKKQILELPLALGGQGVLRAPEAFVFLTPGTTGPGSADSNNGVFLAKLGGGQNFGNEIILDGASAARADSGSSFDQTAPSVEALQEFKVTTSTVPAEFGRTSGGVESFATRSGTNSFHGAVYDIFRNEDLNANTWFNNFNLGLHPDQKAQLQRPLDRKNDYGGTFGGPVWIPKIYNGRDKTFFFFSWEQYRQTAGGISHDNLPSAAMRNGDFSSFLGGPVLDSSNNPVINPCDGTTVLQGQIFDPATTTTVGSTQCRTAFPGNIIPAGRFSSVAQNILKLIPQPTSGGIVQNFTFTTHNPILSTTMSFRIDHSLSDKSKLFFSYSSRDNENTNGTPALPQPLDPTFFSSFITHYERVGWDYFFSPEVLNHLNVGLNRVNSNSVAGAVNGTDWDKAIGLNGASGPTFPPINFGGRFGFQSLGDPNADDDVINGLVVADSVSWQRGRHSFRAGLDWRAAQFSIIDKSHQSPSIGFQPDQTAFQPSQGGLTGNEFASFLVGAPSNLSLAVRSEQPRFNSNYYAAYFQDNWKVSNSLVLNLGVRYDVETARTEAHANTSNFDPNVPNPGATGVLGALVFAGHGAGRSGRSGTWAQTWKKDIAPRIGFAWAPQKYDRKVALRGGYGIYYAPLTYGDFGQALTDGFTASPSFISNDSFSPALLLDAGIPAFPPPPNLDPAQDNGGSGGGFGGITYVSPKYGRPGMVQNWSLELEHQLATDLILNIGYVGQHATHLRSSLAQINNLNPKFFSLGNALGQPIDGPVAASLGLTPPFPEFTTLYGPGSIAQALRPYPQYGSINTDCCLENLGQSTYEALLVKLERRFHNGLNLLASYTWSKTLTDADSALPAFTGFSGGGSVQNSYNLKGEKSLSYQDIPHTFVLSYVYELPIGPGKKYLSHGVASKVLGGWQVGGVQRYQSGQPLAFGCATGVPAYDGCIRYDRVPGQPLRTNSTFDLTSSITNGNSGCTPDPARPGFFTGGSNSYFNCGAFFDPNFTVSSSPGVPYLFGNFPRISGEVRSQRYFNEDFSIIKRTLLTESAALVLKAELFNAFNRHTFRRP
ncbi:MAG: TonB-dependent receptor, partial [Acidobacteriota bacterium]|nr:TonB-dependent receptor [Acidobacteriota bacterium]